MNENEHEKRKLQLKTLLCERGMSKEDVNTFLESLEASTPK